MSLLDDLKASKQSSPAPAVVETQVPPVLTELAPISNQTLPVDPAGVLTGRKLHVYKNTMPSANYVFRNGKQAPFIKGRYTTDVPAEIQELDEEVKQGHPHIFVDVEDAIIDSGLVNPMNALRHKIIQEYLQNEAAATDPNRNMGTTDQSAKLIVGNTRDIADAALGGSGQMTAARTFTPGK